MKYNELASKMVSFESGRMQDEDMINFFQELIDTGMVWKLQGFYGRQARFLINNGYCRLASTPAPSSNNSIDED